jgi:hygromycin-B 7''-O-kinase
VRIEGGTNLVYASSDGSILKIFPPHEVSFFQTECAFLKYLYGRLPVHTPALHAADDWDDFLYIIMEQIQGTPLTHVWGSLSLAERCSIVSQIGEMVRSLHGLPTYPLADLPVKWDAFIDQQQANLLSNHTAYGLPPEWLDQLPNYIDAIPLDLHNPARMAPLHTELMQEHLFVKPEGNGWVISGLIDFEPSMVGHREYELGAVGLFITQGDHELWRMFLSAYGFQQADLTPELSRRIMKWVLLHRYSNLQWFLTLIPEGVPKTKFEHLEQYWFGLD